MAVRVTTRVEQGVAVVEVAGRLAPAEGESALHAAVTKALDSGQRRVVLDLAQVTTADSSGLGELIRCKATCNRRGAELRLAGATVRMRQLLVMCSLSQVFDVDDDVSLAMAALSQPRAGR